MAQYTLRLETNTRKIKSNIEKYTRGNNNSLYTFFLPNMGKYAPNNKYRVCPPYYGWLSLAHPLLIPCCLEGMCVWR